MTYNVWVQNLFSVSSIPKTKKEVLAPERKIFIFCSNAVWVNHPQKCPMFLPPVFSTSILLTSVVQSTCIPSHLCLSGREERFSLSYIYLRISGVTCSHLVVWWLKLRMVLTLHENYQNSFLGVVFCHIICEGRKLAKD